MKFVKVFCVAIFLTFGVLTFFSAARTAPKASENSAVKNNPQSSVAELYAQNCARCHGADGRGQTFLGKNLDTPNISDAAWQKRYSDKKIAAKIRAGGNGMPAFGKKLSAKEINSLVAHVRSLKK